MARRFVRPRVPKKYVWVDGQAVGQFNAGNVVQVQLVNGSDFAVGGGLGLQAHTLNIIRIVGSVTIAAASAQLLDNISDEFIAGPVIWGLYIQDLEDATVIDPEALATADETCLGSGITESIGILLETAAFVGGTGLGSTFGHHLPFSTNLKFDVHTNRRLSNDQELKLNMSRPVATAMSLEETEDYEFQMIMRVLIKLP